MSEENTTQETTQETTSNPPQDKTIDLDATVKVGGEEISIKQLIDSRDEAGKYKEYNEQARKLISPQMDNPQERESAIRYLMTQEGYSPNDIEEYIGWSNDATSDTSQQEHQGGEIPNQDFYPEQDPQMEQYLQEQERMKEQEQQRMMQIEDRQSQLSTEMMKRDMNTALNSTVEDSDKFKKLLSLSSGEDSKSSEILRQEVESAMMQNLRNRRTKGESFNKSWFGEEASNAVNLVYDKFRSVIGDPDKIQRSPETATDSDNLFNKPPVDPPKYEKGDDMGKINVKTREWTLDTLLRGARDGAAGGESKT